MFVMATQYSKIADRTNQLVEISYYVIGAENAPLTFIRRIGYLVEVKEGRPDDVVLDVVFIS